MVIPSYMAFLHFLNDCIGRSRGRASFILTYSFRFFRFDIQHFRNVTTSRVAPPPPARGQRPLPPPQREILDPPLQKSSISENHMLQDHGLVGVKCSRLLGGLHSRETPKVWHVEKTTVLFTSDG